MVSHLKWSSLESPAADPRPTPRRSFRACRGRSGLRSTAAEAGSITKRPRATLTSTLDPMVNPACCNQAPMSRMQGADPAPPDIPPLLTVRRRDSRLSDDDEFESASTCAPADPCVVKSEMAIVVVLYRVALVGV